CRRVGSLACYPAPARIIELAVHAGYASYLEFLVGEQRRGVAVVTAGCTTSEQRESASLGSCQRGKVTPGVAVKGRVVRRQAALKRRQRIGHVVERHRVALTGEGFCEQGRVFRHSTQIGDDLLRYGSHFVLVGHWRHNLRFEVRGAPIPEEAGLVSNFI